MKKKKILFYDIETTPILAYVWRFGKQRVGPNQVQSGRPMNDIICITYCWNDDKPAKAIGWGYKEQDSSKVIKEFDKLVEKADVTIGKNNKRFDEKHINTQRLLHGLDPLPDWILYSDDLERHMRRHFALPSYSLDYFSHLLGLGGKISMQFSDWIDIVEQKNRASYTKMLEYGKKDIEDTRAIWNHCEKHFLKSATDFHTSPSEPICTRCGCPRLNKLDTRQSGTTTWVRYRCGNTKCRAYVGRAPIKKNGEVGKIR